MESIEQKFSPTQLPRAEQMRVAGELIATEYEKEFGGLVNKVRERHPVNSLN